MFVENHENHKTKRQRITDTPTGIIHSSVPIVIEGSQKYNSIPNKIFTVFFRYDELQLGKSQTDRHELEQQQLRQIISKAAK